MVSSWSLFVHACAYAYVSVYSHTEAHLCSLCTSIAKDTGICCLLLSILFTCTGSSYLSLQAYGIVSVPECGSLTPSYGQEPKVSHKPSAHESLPGDADGGSRNVKPTERDSRREPTMDDAILA